MRWVAAVHCKQCSYVQWINYIALHLLHCIYIYCNASITVHLLPCSEAGQGLTTFPPGQEWLAIDQVEISTELCLHIGHIIKSKETEIDAEKKYWVGGHITAQWFGMCLKQTDERPLYRYLPSVDNGCAGGRKSRQAKKNAKTARPWRYLWWWDYLLQPGSQKMWFQLQALSLNIPQCFLKTCIFK